MRSRAFLASCEAAFASLPWFFHWDLPLQMEIPGLPEKRVLVEVPCRRSGVPFPAVWLSCPALLWFRCSGILFPLVWLSYDALL